MSRIPPSSSEKALGLLRHLPRLSLDNLSRLPGRKLPGEDKTRHRVGNKHKKRGCGNKGNKARQNWAPLGWESGSTPITKTTPMERTYNYGWHAQKQYPPLSLKKLQFLIDTGRLDPTKPIDLAALCATKVFYLHPDRMQFGFNLTDEGCDVFETKVNIEVQWTNEQSIAAIERLGGVITTAYYDIFSLKALANAKGFFESGAPIPRRMIPPRDCIGFYTDPKNRGYLSDPKAIGYERLVLAQKYGYELKEIDENDELLAKQFKDPRQVFYGLEAGWVVNLRERAIYKPSSKVIRDFYNRP